MGPVELDPRQIFHFPHGLYAFEALRSFALLDSAHPPFYWLQSLEHKELAFLLLSPRFLVSGYSVQSAAGEDFSSIGIRDHEDANLLVFCIVTLNEQDSGASTANMRGPLILNKGQNLGRQIIVNDERWSVRQPLASV